ncbi:MAG: high frequency lysogenization protein HflD [Parvularcula sp.]
MFGILVLGFFMGMSHALEADHLAAIAAMSGEKSGGRRKMMLRGAFWGAGHTLTLFFLGGLVLLFGFVLTDAGAARLEFSVGVMLVLLGGHLFYRLVSRRIHFHAHEHGDGQVHLHAHSHAGDTTNHARSSHDHAHPAGLPWRALFVGLMHGAAGSAGLLTLAIATTQSPVIALGYIFIFGVGSICGMALLSYAVAWPLGMVERSAKALHLGVTVAAGLLAIGIGMNVMASTMGLAWGLS